MASAKHGLGRGLGALITSLNNKSEEIVAPLTSGRSIVTLDISRIAPNPRQPRKTFDDVKLDELTMSIKEQGVTSPVLVRKKGDSFELIAGERRLRATKKAGLNTIPAIIKDFSDEQSLEIAIVENLQREDLNPIEEAFAYKSLSGEFDMTHDQIAKKVGKDRSTVSNALRLLDLPQEIIDSIASSEITAGHARPLLGIDDMDHQMEVWREIVKKDLSVRDVEALLSIIAEKSAIRLRRSGSASGGKKQKNTDHALKDIEDRLAEKLGTKIEIHGSPQKGHVRINYYSQEDLERIIEQICV